MLIPIEEIEQFCNQLRNEGKSIVFTNGCFDILHVGHTTYLQKAKDLGDVLILGLNSDASVRRLKGELRPINNENDRATVLLALRSIDHVVIFPEDTPFNLISLIQPDILAKGSDYSRDTIVGADIVEARSGKVVVIPLVDGKSTTATINKMQTNC